MAGMLESLPFVVLTLAFLLQQHLRDRRRDDAVARERYDWMRERQELANRIQAPHLIPRPMPLDPAPEAPAADEDEDEFDRQGEILVGAES
jgi:hypothetical protein